MLESKFYFKKVIIKYYTPALFVGFMNINSFKHIDLIIKKHLDMIGTIETKNILSPNIQRNLIARTFSRVK